MLNGYPPRNVVLAFLKSVIEVDMIIGNIASGTKLQHRYDLINKMSEKSYIKYRALLGDNKLRGFL